MTAADRVRQERAIENYVSHYRKLPNGNRNDILSWVRGEIDPVDGQTHNFYRVTNRDIVEVLTHIFGYFDEFTLADHTFYSNGERSTQSNLFTPNRRVAADERFNSTDLECKEPLARYTIDHGAVGRIVAAIQAEVAQRESSRRADAAWTLKDVQEVVLRISFYALLLSAGVVVFYGLAKGTLYQWPVGGVAAAMAFVGFLANSQRPTDEEIALSHGRSWVRVKDGD